MNSLPAIPSGKTFVKICGITRADDGVAAVEAGADLLGFIRWSGSPRFRSLDECVATLREIRERTGGKFEAVGVYVDAPLEEILAEQERAHFDRIQLHGDEPMSLIEALRLPVIKTIKIRDESSIDRAAAYPNVTLLTDTHDPALPGGTGRQYDPRLIRDLARTRPVLVAGGLTPENVVEVIRFLRPYGVDISSSIEISPGVKDTDRVRAFIDAVRSARDLNAPIQGGKPHT